MEKPASGPIGSRAAGGEAAPVAPPDRQARRYCEAGEKKSVYSY